jgi:hypothetical protein
MNNLNECIWKKYDEKLAEIESRLAGKKRNSISKEQAQEAIPALHTEQGTKLIQAEARIANIIAENNRLKEETKFLKLENDASVNLKEEISSLKYEFERISRERDAEISTLFAKNKRLESEAAKLAMDNRRMELRKQTLLLSSGVTSLRKSNAGAGPVLSEIKASKTINEITERTGILQWLSKPLIVVKTR